MPAELRTELALEDSRKTARAGLSNARPGPRTGNGTGVESKDHPTMLSLHQPFLCAAGQAAWVSTGSWIL